MRAALGEDTDGAAVHQRYVHLAHTRAREGAAVHQRYVHLAHTRAREGAAVYQRYECTSEI